jgi:hypothetical protein
MSSGAEFRKGKMSLEVPLKTQEEAPDAIEMPASTAWPIVLAFGITLVFAGMLTTSSVSIVGAILALSGYFGWFRDVLPHEKHQLIPESAVPSPAVTSRPKIDEAAWITHALHRARLPLELYPISAGIKGGLAGSVAMAAIVVGYGLIDQHSLWYPINLLAAGFFPGEQYDPAQLAGFHQSYLIVATLIHLTTSLLVGLLYGAMLPMFPRRPILLGGVIAPVMWSVMIHSFVNFLNPELAKRIDWPWFVASQVGFGIVAGIVVSRQERVRTWQHLPFNVRAGFEGGGAMHEKEGEEPQ